MAHTNPVDLASAALAIVLSGRQKVPAPVFEWARTSLIELAGEGRVAVDAAAMPQDADPHYAAFSSAQAREALAAFSAALKAAIREMLADGADGFDMNQLAHRLKRAPSELRGIWTGLTRVTRRVMGDPEGYLLHWVTRADGTYFGRLHPQTFEAFSLQMA